jgi:hypothetical protein
MSIVSRFRCSFLHPLSIAICLSLTFAGAASAQTKVEPCATMGGKPKAFNAANGNPYNCTIDTTTNSDGSEDIVIHQPVVGSEAKNGFRYPIPLLPNDLITISADGCVQTAGSGKTWKKYVNPEGKDSGPHTDNGLYFGTISIAGGVTSHGPLGDTALDNLSASHPAPAAQIFVEPVQQVPGRSNPQFLVLGYKDDNYDDHGGNGYWGHDDGDNNQCAHTDPHVAFGSFGGPAFVKLHIVHNAQNPFTKVNARQWDLVPHGFDVNGLPENPEWGWQVNGGSIAKDGNFTSSCLAKGCSSQEVSFDSASLTASNWPDHLLFNVCNFDTGPAGHRNWTDVTYTGTVTWVEHSSSFTGDDDYNMRNKPPTFHTDPAGTSFANNTPDNAHEVSFIGLEFDSDETIDHFDQNAFWKKFHQTVDNMPDEAVGGMIDGHDVVVVGLMGFDEMHDAHSEIHPVHALAIREGTQGQELEAVNPGHDRWFFFVRNWGDEGECSRYQHYLQTNVITLQIPPPTINMVNPPKFGAATLNQGQSQVLGTGTDGVVHFFSNAEGTFVTFNLSNAVDQPFAFGEFELAWAELPGSHGPHAAPSGPAPGPKKRTSPPDEPEGRLARIWNGATPQQQQLYRTLLQELTPPKRAIISKALTINVATSAPRRPEKAPAVTVGPATEKLQRDAARWHALCAATGGRLPTQATWCAQAKVPPVTVVSTAGGGAQRTPLTATLTVYDASGAGLGPTQYSFDGKTWTTYTGPFTVPAGNATLYHRAQDRQGNMEEIREHKFSANVETPVRETR